jgi:multidrug efflux pump subunit AcrB
MGKALGFMALMGVVGLVGVVVNDSIVLVNQINIRKKDISDISEAIKDACISRFRPVMLTTLTTVAGLLPIAHATGGDPFLKPMALSFAYGLLFSTLITLIFVPISYLLYIKSYGLVGTILNRFSGGTSSIRGEDPTTARTEV